VSAVADFFAEFLRAFSHLVAWAYALGVLAYLLQGVVKSRAWRNMLAASFPDATVRWRDAYGAYLVKNGAGTFLPMHGDDAIRVALMKDRIEGASPAAVAATAGVEVLFDVVLTAVLVGLSAWLGASVVDWHEVAAHPAKPAVILALVLVAVVTALVALRRKAKGLGDELIQGLAIFKRRGAYARSVLVWQALDFALQLASLYLLLVAFGFADATVISVILIRTAQRVTVSLPGFLETGSQQAMIVAILTRGGHTAGQALGFGFGSKVTTAGLDIVLALSAARVMIGPLHLLTRIRGRLHRKPAADVSGGGFPRAISEGADAASAGRAPSST
jgi:uncharacterized membrane protein YbhN (UPF0104 family)